MTAPRTILLVAAFLIAVAALAPAAQARQAERLDGDWEYVFGDAHTIPGGDSAWQPVQVPSALSWKPDGPHCVWFRKAFAAPAEWRGQRITLRLEGVKYSHTAYLNGREIGRHTGGYEPAEYDITESAVFSGENQLLVAAEDWTSLVAPDAVAPMPSRASEFASWIKDGVLAPIGSRGWEVGLWQGASIEARPPVWVKDVFITTSVRQRLMRVEITLRNDGREPAQVSVAAHIAQGGPGPEFERKPVSLAAGAEVTTALEASWPDARLWSPESPHLYTLSVTADSDTQDVRFGFREFWIERGQFILNGRPINLLATAAHPMSEYDDDPARAYAAARSAGCVAMRLHAQPWPKQWYQAADETGMLLIWESALWCLSPNYALTRDEFWRNARAHIAAQVREQRNHPSIVIWSAENELLLCGGDQVQGTEGRLGEIADLIRSMDPTRPVMFDGDEDPAGKADVVNLHYPHEFPRWTLWPETAYWFDSAVVPDAYPKREWRWSRTKPLYLGEFLWVPAQEADAPSLFFGDRAYPDTEIHHRMAKAIAWQAQVIAARDAGVSGMCPWNLWEMGDFPNVGYNAHTRAYQPIAAFLVEASTCFFAGEAVERTLTVLNDSGVRRDLQLRWRLAPDRPEDGTWEVKGAEPAPLDTAGRQRVRLRAAIPAISSPVAPATFTVELWEGDRRLFSESHEWKLYRRTELSGPVPRAPRGVALYDPKGDTARLLREISLSWQPLTEANATQVLSNVRVVIIGRDALESPRRGRLVVGEDSAFLGRLLRFADSGGVVLVFEQRNYPGMFPPAALSDRDSTIAFRRHADHPILAGLESADLAHWYPDGIVARREIVKPDRGGFLALTDSGGSDGLATAGLAELEVGEGRVLLCQLDVTAKFGVNPIAARIVRNLIAYTGEQTEARGLTAAVCDDSTAGKLDAIGLKYERIKGPAASVDLSRYGQLLICDADWAAAGAPQLQRFVRSGGRVVLHGIQHESAARLDSLLGEPVLLRDGGDGRVVLVDRGGPAVTVSNDMLTWFSPSPSPFSAPALSPDIARYVVQRPYREVGARTSIEAETMRASGAAVDRPDGGAVVGLYANGDLASRITVPRAGTFAMVIRARGTPAEGAYPRIDIVVDDAPIGSVSPASDEWRELTALVNLPGGEHQLRLVFANDLQTATEDRNVWVDWAEWAPAALSPTKFTFHTDPGALVSARDGCGVWVVDQVRWDNAGHNEEKGARYLANLLTALGCQFEHEAGESIEARQMAVRDAELWQQTGDGVSLATNGTLETAVDFASTGQYGFAIRASGTPVASVYPIVEVRLDGRKVGEVELASGNARTYRLRTPVQAGTHQVSLSFVNDAWQPPEDRNLTLNRLTIWKEGSRP